MLLQRIIKGIYILLCFKLSDALKVEDSMIGGTMMKGKGKAVHELASASALWLKYPNMCLFQGIRFIVEFSTSNWIIYRGSWTRSIRRLELIQKVWEERWLVLCWNHGLGHGWANPHQTCQIDTPLYKGKSYYLGTETEKLKAIISLPFLPEGWKRYMIKTLLISQKGSPILDALILLLIKVYW